MLYIKGYILQFITIIILIWYDCSIFIILYVGQELFLHYNVIYVIYYFIIKWYNMENIKCQQYDYIINR
jgi:hypothetical protein